MGKYHFSGWATRNDLRCSDGRTIKKDAFKNNNGERVPLVWSHQHNDSMNVLGHVLLENRDGGVYAYGTFNDTESGLNAKKLVEHGDITALSIYANKLKQRNGDVLHGNIREVSLVLAGANPGAFIDNIIKHGDVTDEEGVIYTGESLELYHSESKESKETKEDGAVGKEKTEETFSDVFETLTTKQKNVVYALIGQALDEAGIKTGDGEKDKEDDRVEKGEETMKHNLFENEHENMDGMDVLTHADVDSIFGDAKRYGSLRESTLAHGIESIDYLFPDAKNMTNTPIFIARDTGWVGSVMKGVHNTPFSRIKSLFADLTEEEARAMGYIKGKLKKEEVFSLLKRTTSPTTIYKKQKLDRDDVVDITDFDVVAWLKSEMRMMLDEEIARAVLVGDGRLSSSDDKINEQNVRPVWTDSDLFTVKAPVIVGANDTDDDKAKQFIRTAVKSRKNYKGSGNPTLFTTEDVLSDLLLLEDKNERVIYKTEAELATALRVKEIITVPVMEDLTRKDDDNNELKLMGIIVNLNDYNIGADKGGAVNMFDDFDIDYNAQKYLIETRCSGALVKPYSAIALELTVKQAAQG